MFTLVANGYIIAAGTKKEALEAIEEDDIAEILQDKYFLKEKEAKELAVKAVITEEAVKEIMRVEKEQTKTANVRAKTEKEKKVVFYKDKDKEFKVEMHKVPTSPYCAALKAAGHKSIYVFTWEEAFEIPFTELPARLQRDYLGVIKRLRPLKDKVVDANESIENKIKENEEE